MQILVESIREMVNVSDVPHGRFEGTLAGYRVRFLANGREFECATESGVRGSCKCHVTVDTSGISVEADVV